MGGGCTKDDALSVDRCFGVNLPTLCRYEESYKKERKNVVHIPIVVTDITAVWMDVCREVYIATTQHKNSSPFLSSASPERKQQISPPQPLSPENLRSSPTPNKMSASGKYKKSREKGESEKDDDTFLPQLSPSPQRRGGNNSSSSPSPEKNSEKNINNKKGQDVIDEEYERNFPPNIDYDDADAVRPELERFFTRYCPKRIKRIDDAMEKWEGNYKVLFDELGKKYISSLYSKNVEKGDAFRNKQREVNKIQKKNDSTSGESKEHHDEAELHTPTKQLMSKQPRHRSSQQIEKLHLEIEIRQYKDEIEKWVNELIQKIDETDMVSLHCQRPIYSLLKTEFAINDKKDVDVAGEGKRHHVTAAAEILQKLGGEDENIHFSYQHVIMATLERLLTKFLEDLPTPLFPPIYICEVVDIISMANINSSFLFKDGEDEDEEDDDNRVQERIRSTSSFSKSFHIAKKRKEREKEKRENDEHACRRLSELFHGKIRESHPYHFRLMQFFWENYHMLLSSTALTSNSKTLKSNAKSSSALLAFTPSKSEIGLKETKSPQTTTYNEYLSQACFKLLQEQIFPSWFRLTPGQSGIRDDGDKFNYSPIIRLKTKRKKKTVQFEEGAEVTVKFQILRCEKLFKRQNRKTAAPFVDMFSPSGEVIGHARTVENTLNPKWENATVEAVIKKNEKENKEFFRWSVWDALYFNRRVCIGCAQLSVEQIFTNHGSAEHELPLKPCLSLQEIDEVDDEVLGALSLGKIVISTQAVGFEDEKKSLRLEAEKKNALFHEQQEHEATEVNGSSRRQKKVKFHILQCENLLRRSHRETVAPSVDMRAPNDHVIGRAKTIENSRNPKWNYAIIETTVKENESGFFEWHVWDADLDHPACIGCAQLSADQVFADGSEEYELPLMPCLSLQDIDEVDEEVMNARTLGKIFIATEQQPMEVQSLSTEELISSVFENIHSQVSILGLQDDSQQKGRKLVNIEREDDIVASPPRRITKSKCIQTDAAPREKKTEVISSKPKASFFVAEVQTEQPEPKKSYGIQTEMKPKDEDEEEEEPERKSRKKAMKTVRTRSMSPDEKAVVNDDKLVKEIETLQQKCTMLEAEKQKRFNQQEAISRLKEEYRALQMQRKTLQKNLDEKILLLEQKNAKEKEMENEDVNEDEEIDISGIPVTESTIRKLLKKIKGLRRRVATLEVGPKVLKDSTSQTKLFSLLGGKKKKNSKFIQISASGQKDEEDSSDSEDIVGDSSSDDGGEFNERLPSPKKRNKAVNKKTTVRVYDDETLSKQIDTSPQSNRQYSSPALPRPSSDQLYTMSLHRNLNSTTPQNHTNNNDARVINNNQRRQEEEVHLSRRWYLLQQQQGQQPLRMSSSSPPNPTTTSNSQLWMQSHQYSPQHQQPAAYHQHQSSSPQSNSSSIRSPNVLMTMVSQQHPNIVQPVSQQTNYSPPQYRR